MKRLFSLAILTLLAFGCGGTTPEGQSGGDAERHQAKPMALGKAEGDSVSTPDGDRTDWKILEMQDAGALKVEVILDNPDAAIVMGLFDRYGKTVTRVTHRKGDGPLITMAADVGLSRYFLMIQAEGHKDKTGYTIKAVVN